MLVNKIIAKDKSFRLFPAKDCIAGVMLARICQSDLTLMDIDLLGIHGMQTMQNLSAEPNTAYIPVVALNANAVPRDIEEKLAAGFFCHLKKSINITAFMHTLNDARTLSGAEQNKKSKL
ncbi:Polar-differentiation response regulator DivK [Polaromonas vacuolata]|uniref:Polar-differentiation response regulator DivK n=1 Tax=Polaromonas vacuolata TaxID=37448 RepID=A0A6H2HBR4_9BURK|nr:response regulator [Polaromonas vacuolata]QJC57315.1 Polar-differentiation response regulator DivK [Polaromonas vacuolata]